MAAVRVIRAVLSWANLVKTSSTGPARSARHSGRCASGMPASSPWTATWMTWRNSVALVAKARYIVFSETPASLAMAFMVVRAIPVAQEEPFRGRQDASPRGRRPSVALRSRVPPRRLRRRRLVHLVHTPSSLP